MKNSGKNVSKFTWSALIKSYNDRALGNVEHLSISSDDSIWEESDFDHSNLCDSKLTSPQIPPIDHCYSTPRGTSHKVSESKRSSLSITQTEQPIKTDYLPQCFQISSTTDFVTEPQRTQKSRRKINFSRKSSNSRTNEKTLKKHLDSKVKKSVRDKNWNYKRMMDELKASSGRILCSKEFQIEGDPLLLSKWKKSAARYQPSNRTYSNASSVRRKAKNFQRQYENFHGREELDAAEALTFLSRASTNKL